MRSCLQETQHHGKNGWWRVVAKFWGFPIALSIAIDVALVLHVYGVDLQQPPVLLIYFTYNCLKWLLAAGVIYFLLRALRLASNFNTVMACYTIIVIYAPIFSVLESPGFHYQLSTLSQVKAQHLDLVGSVQYLFRHAREMQESGFDADLSFVFVRSEGVLVLLLNAVVAEALVAYLLSDRLKTYLVVWLSSAISFFPTLVLAALKTVVLYNYIS